MVILQKVDSLMEGEWSCYRSGTSLRRMVHVIGGVQFNGGRMVMLQRRPV